MASQPLAFAELLAGGVLLTMGLGGYSVRDVLAGKAKRINPIAGPGGAGATATATTMQGVSYAPGQGSEQLPASKRAARLLRGVVDFEGTPVAAWIYPYLTYARSHGWTGTVTSGYRSYAEQKRIYDSGVRPAAEPGTSNHEGKAFPRGAVDVSEASQLAQILSRLPGALLKWAGSADPVHFSFPHGGSY